MIRWWKTRQAIGLLRSTFRIPRNMSDLQVFKFTRFALADSELRGLDVPDEIITAFDWLDNNL